ncbi:serine/threonine protein kinase ELM1 [Kluyveromyces lactis]|uniref:non-specific serine/threonine protein kinase n=1 Tax=Kluyveromyces lactis (strain ATCC 8585 / CBS 2359 / DSM 70799 / NBRC 1267 / NRRL Y-1140 / WM37) TaxID=284590 RepID=Q6CIF9_KLULA|nr:uncharacterized protein KLLA0_F26983g [Kluyveromyces lactis]CAG98988.1 KLLA0F26983p [Kluyveromyces lactis]|eukprot:XP_456280.1 uncharacterized protein KLLA0_F26983g [Kluyveromyces lactis]
MKKYPTIIQFPESIRIQPMSTDPESYFQIIDEQQKKLELGVISKTKIIERYVSASDSDSDSQEEHAQKFVNQYRIGERLGCGQFGTVYKGHTTGKVVAIKQIYKKPMNSPFSMSLIMKTMKRYESISGDVLIMEMNVSKIRWECFVTSKLNHPNVIQLLECLDSPYSDQIWLIQPLAVLGELQWSRESKFDLIEQWKSFYRGQLDSVEEFAVKVLGDISNGLQYLQGQGIIHRDLKPQNILLDPVYHSLRISDFGCSLIVPSKLPFKDGRLQDLFEKELNKIVGTPLFTAPELCNFAEGSAHASNEQPFKIDVWSLGITVYAILYNVLPFWGETEFDTYNLICHRQLKPDVHNSSNIYGWIHEYVVNRMLSKNTASRPTTSNILRTLESHSKSELSSMNKMKLKLNKWKKNLLTKNKNTEILPTQSFKEDFCSPASSINAASIPLTDKKQPLNRSHRATVNLEKYIK